MAAAEPEEAFDGRNAMLEIRKRAGRLLAVLAACLCLCVFTVRAEIPAPSEEFYVNDEAGIFSSEQVSQLCAESEKLDEQTGAQIVVLTVDSTDGQEISDYSVEVGRDWGIGSGKENNGVLIVLSLEDRKVWIAVGYGLEGRLPDAKTGRLLDENAVPYYKEDKFAEGTICLYYAVLNEVRQEYDLETVEMPEIADADGNAGVSKKDDDLSLGDFFKGIFLIVFVFVLPVWLVCALIPFVLILLLRLLWLCLCRLRDGAGGGRAARFKKKYFSGDALWDLAIACLFWPLRVLFLLMGDSDDDGDSGSSGGGGSFGGGGAGRDF